MGKEHMHVIFSIALIFGYTIFIFLVVNAFVYYENIVSFIK